MLVAALLVVPVIVIEEADVGDPWRTVATVLNWMIWVAFAIELVVMLSVVRDRWRWIRTHPLEVAIVIVTPPFLPSALQAARVLRLLRLIRLLRIAKLARRVFSSEGLQYIAIDAVGTHRGIGTSSSSFTLTYVISTVRPRRANLTTEAAGSTTSTVA